MKVNNAIIMAAGTASRFAPLSFEKHKALIEVKGEILIERQIRQLQEAGIKEIIVVTGYMAEQFEYLKKKYGVVLVHNPDYLIRNNNASIYVVREYLKILIFVRQIIIFLTIHLKWKLMRAIIREFMLRVKQTNGVLKKIMEELRM